MRAALFLIALVALAPVAAACDGLSPGDEITMDGKRCTLAWLVADASGLYFTTAGHCVSEGSRVHNPALDITFGEAVFSFDQDGPGVDFALIRIDPAHYASLNPRMCTWGGPTGIYRDTPGSGNVRHHGYGTLLGENPFTRPREGMNLYWDGGPAFYWTGTGVLGDSGSAVVHEDGRAIGVLTHLTLGVSAQTNGGTHLDEGFRLAAERGYDLRLVLQGEDPVQVLREMRGEAPPPASGTETPPPGTPDTQAPPQNEPDPGAPSPETPPPGDPVVQEPLDPQRAPAAQTGDNGVPGFAPLAVLGAALVAAFRRRA